MARSEHDYYRTEPWMVEPVLWRLKIDPRRILEPCAGDGALIAPLRHRWPDATVDAYDIEPRSDFVRRSDFLTQWPGGEYDLIITNPPYSHAEAFTTNALARVRRGGHVALLLRLGFLASQQRRGLYHRNMPEHIFILCQRPSFTGRGSDFTEYAWFVWRKGRRSNRSTIWRID